MLYHTFAIVIYSVFTMLNAGSVPDDGNSQENGEKLLLVLSIIPVVGNGSELWYRARCPTGQIA